MFGSKDRVAIVVMVTVCFRREERGGSHQVHFDKNAKSVNLLTDQEIQHRKAGEVHFVTSPWKSTQKQMHTIRTLDIGRRK